MTKTPPRSGRMPAPPAPREAGPPPIDPKRFELLAELNCTPEEAADFLGVAAPTLERWLEHPELAVAWKRGAAKGRVKLRRAQLNLAKHSAAMAIHLGRLILGQNVSEKKPDGASKPGGGAGGRPTRDEIARRIAGIAARRDAPGDPERSDGSGGG